MKGVKFRPIARDVEIIPAWGTMWREKVFRDMADWSVSTGISCDFVGEDSMIPANFSPIPTYLGPQDIMPEYQYPARPLKQAWCRYRQLATPNPLGKLYWSIKRRLV